MDAERETLQRHAYPEVRTFCQEHGLAFEVVDLRWGIQNPEATDLLPLELCLEELDRCREATVGPSFVALVGDLYGPCLVPTRIEEKEWEALRASLATRPHDLDLVARSFRRDENAVPPVYILQAAGNGQARPEEATLSSALRAAAREARSLGLLSQEQCDRHHLSVLSGELERGALTAAPGDQGATVFLREVQGLSKHVLEDCALGLVDRLPDGCLDTEAQDLLRDLKERLATAQPGVLRVHSLPWSRDLVNPKNRAHARYLRELGEQFVARANLQVLQHLREQAPDRHELAWLYQEVCHHLGQGIEATRTFCGRQELLAQLGQRLQQDDSRAHIPLVLFGPPGIGKTALMCKLAEQIPALLRPKTVVVLRLLGSSRSCADAQVLLKSVCFQVCLAFGLPPPPAQVLEAHSRLALFFHILLHTVSRRNFESLVLLLDAVDAMEAVGHAQRVPWLPRRCPPRVHLVLSVGSGPLGMLDALREMLPDPDAYWEVKPLSGRQGQEMVQLLLAAAGRTLSPLQRDLLWAGLPDCGHPGRLRLAFDEACTWASFSMPTPLATSAEEATHQFCARLEQTHGPLLVAHVLGYIESSRHGLSEAELKDVLSLDDELLQEVYRDWTPPSHELLRFPPLLWVRLRRDLGTGLARRLGDSATLLAISHRQLAEVVRARYLSEPERAKRHGVLADFFLGTWSQGARKLITLPFVGKPLSLDRKVAPQPLWFSDSVANTRKLEELPLHLLRAGRVEELRQEVLGSMNWLSCRAFSGGIDTLLGDLDMCAPHVGGPELDLVREALQLCRPALELHSQERSVLYTELLARLQGLAPSHPVLVGPLCQQAQSWFRACPHPVLVPLMGFLLPPGGPLRATLSGCHKGITVMAWSPEGQLLVVGTQDGILVVWDMEEQQVTHVLTGHTAAVKCVAVLARGPLALSASADGSLRLWHLLSGQERRVLRVGGSGALTGSQTWALHVDDAEETVYLVSGSQLSAWCLETAELLFQVLDEAPEPWHCVALLASRAVLLAVSGAGEVGMWNSATGMPQGRRRLSSVSGEDPTCALPVQRHGWAAAGFSGGSITLVSPDCDRLLDKLPGSVRFLVPSEDESLVAAGFGRVVRLFWAEAQGLRPFASSDLDHEDLVEAAVFGPSNNLLVTGSRDALIQVWSLPEQGALLHVLEGVGGPASLLARAGALVASASPQSSSFRVWDLTRRLQPQACQPFPDRSGLTAVSHNGSYVFFPKIGDKSKVTVWDVAEGTEQDTLDAPSEVRCLEVAEQAKLLFAGLASGAVLVFPLQSRQDVLCLPPPEARKAVTSMALSKLEDRLSVAYDSLVLVLDVGPGDPCPVLDGPRYTFNTQLPEAITRVAVLADYRVLYGMTSGDLFLYECMRSEASLLEGHRSCVTCVDVGHEGLLAVSGSEQSHLCLWDLQTCKWKFQMSYRRSYCHGVQCASFSMDDKYVFAGMRDRSVIVWSTLDGTLLTVQFVHAELDRIVPTSNGFLAPSRHGYVIRERFHCPSSRASQKDPLKNFKKAVWMVKCRQKEEGTTAVPQDPASEAARERRAKSSQVCLIV
ncbi:NACHT domain- and WD repeat-containing protein 1 [Ctenodactylus gundi]